MQYLQAYHTTVHISECSSARNINPEAPDRFINETSSTKDKA